MGPASILLASAACSSESGGEATQTVVQQLEAGEFVVINEVEVNPPGGDTPFAYIELEGTPGVSLVDFQVAVVNGATGNIVMVVNLGTACGGPCAIGSNGLLMIKAADVDGGEAGHAAAAGTTVVKDAQFNTTNLPHDDAAVLLVQGPAAIIEGGTMTRPDGGTATLPVGDTLADGVGFSAGGGFAGVTVSNGSPDGLTRLPGHFDTSASAWYSGELAAGSNSNVAYVAGAGVPVGALLTPGAANYPFDTDGGVDAATDSTTQEAATEASTDATTDASSGDGASTDSSTGDATPANDASTSDARDGGGTTDGAVGDTGPSSDARADGASTDGGGSGGSAGAGGAAGGSAGAGGAAGGAAGSGGRGGTAGAGMAGTAGRGGSGGSASGAGGSKAGAAGSGAPPASDDSGCGCRTVGTTPGHESGMRFALLGLGAALAFRRRKSRNSDAR